MRRGGRATSPNRTAFVTSCSRAESFWKIRRAERGGEKSKLIGYLQGTLKHLDANSATVVTGGVGYEVHISLQTYYKLEGQREAVLEIYTHVREDTLALYGFASSEEKFAFEKLISISGIGPTLAVKILSGIEPTDLADAVAQSDVRKLSSIPGVGRKTADRICLELRDKL